jgi:hypothetical protein
MQTPECCAAFSGTSLSGSCVSCQCKQYNAGGCCQASGPTGCSGSTGLGTDETNEYNCCTSHGGNYVIHHGMTCEGCYPCVNTSLNVCTGTRHPDNCVCLGVNPFLTWPSCCPSSVECSAYCP